MLTGEMSDRLEDLQKKALKTIYGWDVSYADLLEISGLSTLKERREEIVDRFAQKTAKDTRFQHWFPRAPSTGHDTRQGPRYLEEFARTERLKNSPVFYMRRRLNCLNA